MGVASIVLGPWASILAISMALLIQAFFFGDGGITAIGANCFNMAIVGSLVAYAVYRAVCRGAALRGSTRRLRRNWSRLRDSRPISDSSWVWRSGACGDMRPEMKRERAITDPHSPLEYRINGVVSNMPEFATAFGCKVGSRWCGKIPVEFGEVRRGGRGGSPPRSLLSVR